MYLIIYLLLVLSIIVNSNGDCGCNLNRNGDCNSNNEIPSDKYSKENNDLHDNRQNGAALFSTDEMVFIEGATFQMGTNKPVFESDFEGPLRNVTVAPFYLDKYEVSNKNFQQFIQQTGYKTEAESFGDSFIFEKLLPESEQVKYEDVRAVQAPWWIKMKGVSWQYPEGPQSDINGE